MAPAAKRTAIMACAERLFAQNGYQQTSMADIAKAADVAVGTLYRLFPDKLSLLAALHRTMEDSFIEAMQTGWNAAENYSDKFEAMVRAIFTQAEAALTIMPLYNLTSDLISVDGYTPGTRMIAAIVSQYRTGVMAGALRDDDLDFVAASAHGMVEGAMKAWAANPSQQSQELAIGVVVSAMTRAFVL
jgi:AcrR family transcriptional regulator